MAKRHKSALKAHRQSLKRREINRRNRGKLKAAIKSFMAKLNTGQLAEAKAELSRVYSVIDKMIQKGILHENAAARRKSRLTRKLLALMRAQQAAAT